MAALTVQEIAPTGIVPTYAAAAALGDTVAANSEERHFIHVKNGDAGSINVTITAVQVSTRVPGVGQLTIANLVVAVAGTSEKMIGPIPPAYINASGNIAVGYSAVTSVTVAALKLPRQS